jgi:putative oxidoreductase
VKIGLTILRAVIGALFFGHGTQKLFGWFGGNGPEPTAQFFENSLGLKPGKLHATAAGAAEAGGGAMIALGMFTPAAAASLIGVMSTAIEKVHFKNGPWVTNGGFEYNLVLIAALLALCDVGPGDLSFDHVAGTEIKGPLVALLALGAGVGGAAILTRAAVEAPEPEHDEPVAAHVTATPVGAPAA